jgi:integrase
MPSAWIITRATSDGGKRYRVLYRLGGRETSQRYAGSFPTKAQAVARKRWVDGELAAMRVPELHAHLEPQRAPTLADAAAAWMASRIDVTDGTRALHRVALNRVLPILGSCRIDELTADDVTAMVAKLSETGRKRETIRKSVKYLAAVLDDNGVSPNPARDKRVRLPHEEPEDMNPPTADHVDAVFRLMPSAYRLPLLWLDWSGSRVGSIDSLQIGDYDEPARRVRLRASTTKTRRGLWVQLPDVLADALAATLPPREDRRSEARLFDGVTSDRLRTAIARACRAAAIPVFSPHDLRHRKISLLHKQGRTWAEIGQFVGQRQLSVTADIYTHVLSDGREVDYERLLNTSDVTARDRAVRTPVRTSRGENR